MIQSALLTSYRLAEHIQFFSHVAALCNANDPEALQIKTPLDEFVAACSELNAVFKASQGSALTQDIEALDQRRDTAIVCLKSYATANAKHFDKTKRNAGNILLSTMGKYSKRIDKLNYQEETSTLNGLLSQIEASGELTQAIADIHATDIITELKSANILFNQTYLARVVDVAHNETESSVVLRKASTAAYYNLLKHIKAHMVISGETAYLPLVQQLNELIDKYNSTAKLRKAEAQTEALFAEATELANK